MHWPMPGVRIRIPTSPSVAENNFKYLKEPLSAADQAWIEEQGPGHFAGRSSSPRSPPRSSTISSPWTGCGI